MKKSTKRLSAVLLCLMLLMVCAMVPAGAEDAYAELPQEHYGDYLNLNNIYDTSDCYSIQGVTADNNYVYCAKINGYDTNAFVTRLDKNTGAKVNMTNASTGTTYFSNLGHANALDTVTVNGVQNLFVTGGATLVRLTISGTKLTTAGTYTATYNGQTASMTAVQIMSASDTQVKVMVKTGRTLYTGTLDPTASSGVIALTKLCTLNVSQIRMKGSVIDYSAFTQQGFDYHDGKVFLPLSGNAAVETINYSIVAVYDMEGAAGDVKNDPSLSFRVISGNYSGLFEIEDVAICPTSGRLFFSVQRRKTASDTDYDAVGYYYGYTYNPAKSTIGPADYRWETVDNEFVSVTDGGNVFNRAERFHGDINDNVMTQCIYSLKRSVILKHDLPWIVEWKSSGNFGGGGMMLASARTRGVTDAPFLFRHQSSSFIAFGAWDGTRHNNYGLTLSDYGIDGDAEHTYRLTNKIAADGSNMIYLSVDGVELGAMNNYYINATDQNTTSNWVSGQDFTFSYIGSYGHPMSNVDLSYLQVWADGIPEDTPDNYRWETTSDRLTSVTTDGFTANQPNMYRGTLTDGTYALAAYRLNNAMVLMHDRAWSVEWKSSGGLSGGTFLLASSNGGNTHDAPFLFRYTDSGLLALGYRDANGHQNFGVLLSDYGINGSETHVYRLTNRVFDDGSNMVYLYVDDVEISAMNNHFVGINAQGTTSDWLNGKDLVFDYIGNSNYSLNGNLEYLQVTEDSQSYTVNFVDHDGTLISTDVYDKGQMPVLPADPARADTEAYTYTFSGWSPAVTAVTGDVTYTATYTVTPRTYTVTFKNEDGTVLSTQQVAYGSKPTAPANPTKTSTAAYTYTFNGWSPAVTTVTGDATYTATYTTQVRNYTITFKDSDGTVLSTQQVGYGAVPTAPADPTKASTAQYHFTFNGWSPAVVAVTGDATYTAGYLAEVRSYQVTFVNEDGTVLKTANVNYGIKPTAPADPTKASTAQYSYTFNGWTPAVAEVTGNATYTATYTANVRSYTVTFKNEDGTVLSTQQVAYGSNPAVPANPTKAANAQYTYTFSGWSPAVTAVTGNATYTAAYTSTVNQYTVIFEDEDGTVLSTQQVAYGSKPTAPANPTKAANAQYTYTFSGWSPAVVAVTGNATYTATYSATVNMYTIVFEDNDGTVLSTQRVAYGDIPVEPETPTKPSTAQYSYTFAGWNQNTMTVTGDATYIATYYKTVNKYTITFVNDDSTVLSEQQVAYGSMPTAPADPTKAATAQYTYTFAGWDSAIVAVTGNATYTATYSAKVNEYTVIFKNEDGTVLSEQQVAYGSMPTAPADPTKAATAQYTYTFAGWDSAIVTVTGNATYTATYSAKVNEYTIIFKNEDGTVLSEQQVAYGSMPTAPADPTKAATAQYTYTFAGWDNAIVAVTGNATYTATYTATAVRIPTVTPAYPTLAFEDEIMYNVYFTVADLDNVALTDMGLLIFASRDEEGTIDNAVEIIPGAVMSNGMYMVHTNGIPAKNLGDAVYFKVYAKCSDGSYVYSYVMGYNAVAYAKTVLNRADFADKDKALVVAMLNYGAAAQTYFDYRTDELMNAFLTAEQQALVSGFDAEMVTPVVSVDANKLGQFVRNGGYTDMRPAVAFEGAFAINYYFTPANTPDNGVTLYYWDLDAYNNADVLTAENATGIIAMNAGDNGVYTGAVTGIPAKYIDRTVFVAGVYSIGDQTYCTGVIAYSLGRYCLNFTSGGSDMAPFAQATVVYGHYTKAYFA